MKTTWRIKAKEPCKVTIHNMKGGFMGTLLWDHFSSIKDITYLVKSLYSGKLHVTISQNEYHRSFNIISY